MKISINQLILWFAFCVSYIQLGSANELNVYKELMANYDKNVRPALNSSHPTVVSIYLTYFTLLNMIWKDEYLTWNSSAFNDTESIRIPSTLLWRPDIVVKSGLNFDLQLSDDLRMVLVLSDGTVESSMPVVITNQCPLSIAAFPFDEQTCTIDLESWIYPSSEIDLFARQNGNSTTGAAVPDAYKGNGEWLLISWDVNTLHRSSSTDNLQYAVVLYEIVLKRQPVYYICVLLIPTFVTATICLFGLFVPASNTGERIEKVNMGLATMLSMAVILGIVAGEMPKSSTLPLLGFYVLAELLLCTIGVGISMLIMFAHQRATTRVLPPPRWVKRIVLLKTNIIFVKKKKINSRSVSTEKSEVDKQIETVQTSAKRLNQVLDNVDEYIEEKKSEDQILLQWTIIFDRIDTLFLVLFNFINVIMSFIMLVL